MGVVLLVVREGFCCLSNLLQYVVAKEEKKVRLRVACRASTRDVLTRNAGLFDALQLDRLLYGIQRHENHHLTLQELYNLLT